MDISFLDEIFTSTPFIFLVITVIFIIIGGYLVVFNEKQKINIVAISGLVIVLILSITFYATNKQDRIEESKNRIEDKINSEIGLYVSEKGISNIIKSYNNDVNDYREIKIANIENKNRVFDAYYIIENDNLNFYRKVKEDRYIKIER